MDGPNSANGESEVHSVGSILDRLSALAERHDRVTIGDVLDTIGDRSYGPALLIPALIEISPIGGIPAVPTFLAVIVAITAIQLALDKEHLWLPGWLQRRSVGGERMHEAIGKLDGVARVMDKWFHGRMDRFVRAPVARSAALLILILCLSVPILEFIPFASTIPMAAIAAFGLALLLRDGLLMLIAISFGAAAGVAGIFFAIDWLSAG
ncbi:exopolysaccharide biosynthesis protein [Alteriqipengyuania sp.]|uniref:exopolysaccharide biosynthesis protein n=1 Tax=Alteriqipengyuania sp. TaxID=2800692 RepID=UPI0035172667